MVIPHKRRATQSDAFSRATRRAKAIFSLRFVVSRLCGMTTLHFFRLAEGNIAFAVVAMKCQQTLVFAHYATLV